MLYDRPVTTATVQQFVCVCDFSQSNKQLARQGTAGMYGMMATIPDKSIVDDFIKEFFSEVYKIQWRHWGGLVVVSRDAAIGCRHCV